MKIGLFFGSFNPIHAGHLIIANYMATYTGLDQVWLVVSPHNPLKEKESLVHTYDRLEMVHLAIDDTENLRVTVAGNPIAADISLPVNANIVVEFLSR